jgi:hypothetical protein
MKKAGTVLAINTTGVLNDKTQREFRNSYGPDSCRAQRELPEVKNDTAVSKAIESVLQMIETKSGNGPEMQKLALLVRRCI